MEILEKIGKWTSPIWWIIVIVGLILWALITFWDKVLWCNKRWYYNAYEFWVFKRLCKKGLTKEQLKNADIWIRHNKKHPNIEEIKLTIEDQRNLLKVT